MHKLSLAAAALVTGLLSLLVTPTAHASTSSHYACSTWVSSSKYVGVRACIVAKRPSSGSVSLTYKLYLRNTSSTRVKPTYAESYLYGGQYVAKPAWYVLEHHRVSNSLSWGRTSSSGVVVATVTAHSPRSNNYAKLDWHWEGTNRPNFGTDAIVRVRF